MQRTAFVVPLARKFPDPNFHSSYGIERHIWFVPVRSVPRDIPLDPNPRVPNVSKRVYREIEQSLLGEGEAVDGTFHLKHKGITILAENVISTGKDRFEVVFSEGQGIVDGGHTFQLILDCLDNGSLPDDQFVKFEIVTHVPHDWIVEIAGGLNTSVQVQPMSLDNLQGRFDWIKDELRNEPYFNLIAWRENDPGDFDARDIVGLLTCFNIEEFPNERQDDPPIDAYWKKSLVLKRFEDRSEGYQRMRPILKDILTLYDTISFEAQERWNRQGGRRSYGNLSIVAGRKRGEFHFPFIGKRSKYRLFEGALYPMLAAFRWLVVIDPVTGDMRWRDGFEEVLASWDANAVELLQMTHQASIEKDRNPGALGKSRNHWSNLHARFAMRDLMAGRTS